MTIEEKLASLSMRGGGSISDFSKESRLTADFDRDAGIFRDETLITSMHEIPASARIVTMLPEFDMEERKAWVKFTLLPLQEEVEKGNMEPRVISEFLQW